MHSTYSDGKKSAYELVKEYRENNIKMIAITDHDTIGAFLELGAHPFEDVTLIPGIEFSSSYKGKDTHILGYNMDITYQPLIDYVTNFKQVRLNRMKKMVENAIAYGYAITFEDVVETVRADGDLETPLEQIGFGKPHLVRTLIRKNCITEADEYYVYNTLLEKGGALFYPKPKITPAEVVQLIHDAGGIAVLAHPVLIGNDVYVMELLELPFDGLECYHSEHTDKDVVRYVQLAKEKNLVISGGSDFHGIGRHPNYIGDYLIDSENVETFMARVNLI